MTTIETRTKIAAKLARWIYDSAKEEGDMRALQDLKTLCHIAQDVFYSEETHVHEDLGLELFEFILAREDDVRKHAKKPGYLYIQQLEYVDKLIHDAEQT